jgi:hypothetical protein
MFLAGGRAIAEFGHVDHILGEILGLGLAGVFIAIGMIAKNVESLMRAISPNPPLCIFITIILCRTH